MNKLIILGAGTPTPTRERFGSSVVLSIEDELIMFDCGPASTHKLIKKRILPTQINSLFLYALLLDKNFLIYYYEHLNQLIVCIPIQ